ncbi:MAG: cysteine--tRNA ligase [Minisyncoccia bacterium]
MWPFTAQKNIPTLRFTNTLSGAKEEFRKKGGGPVLMYSCGPTVYGPQHIGNLRAAVFSDTVARALTAAQYKVRRIINITDVGHLVGDGDEGEDKMAVGAARDHTTPEEIATRYTAQYLSDIKELGIDTDAITFPRATAYIKEQIGMIATLEKKGLAYKTSDGVYFDTQRFPEYGALGNVQNVVLKAGVRVAVGEKKSEHDFVLWRNAKPKDLQQWDSPWGKGNPGWSIECSAMAIHLLAPTIDIHTGGQDHIQVHHNNEIAQSEGATERRPFVRYWLHNAFLTIDGEKISKSLGNTFTLEDVKKRGIHPLALRLLFLQAHYRSPLSFTWESLGAAEEALKRLWRAARVVQSAAHEMSKKSSTSEEIRACIFDDVATPKALATLYDALGSSLSPKEKWGVLIATEEVLGLSLTHPPLETKRVETERELPEDLQELALRRARARENKDFEAADELRIHIENSGYLVVDGASGTTYTKIER